MKRLIAVTALILLTGMAFSQQPAPPPAYTQRALELLGLTPDEIQEILQIQEEASVEIRRHRADQEIKKAELARLLLDEDPNMRLVERNLREAAEIEVAIRMVEIRREVAVRQIVGTERWARIVQALRARRDQIANDAAEQTSQRLREMQQAIAEKQRELTDLVQNRRNEVLSDEDIRRQYQELQQLYLELQRVIRERL
ncbi:MAG: hypothetical protein KAU31_07140 [Spirochaetaceae bacterium]|nr:hypothetical protein [Spirochaetaceae bacterium]